MHTIFSGRSFFWNWRSENNPLLLGQKEKHNPLLSGTKEQSATGNGMNTLGVNIPSKDDVKASDGSLKNLEKEMRDMETSMQKQNDRYISMI